MIALPTYPKAHANAVGSVTAGGLLAGSPNVGGGCVWFADAFAADVQAAEAGFMADSQVPWGVDALNGTISDPAWRSKPSWYLIVTEDRMIPSPAQRTMAERAGATTAEVPGSHAIYVSQPSAVARLIAQAAQSVRATSWVA